MRAKCKIFLCIISIVILDACKQEYPLPQETRNLNLLVVEGILNAGQGATVVRLSRSFDPTVIGNVIPELSAQVTVEGDDNTSFVLTGGPGGEYTHSQLNLQSTQKYRLRIETLNGNEYLSDYVPVQPSPAIDSIYWRRNPEGIQIFVDTHDDQNKTWYYRWEYDETWEINSEYHSDFQYVNDSVIVRRDPTLIYFCWKSDNSTSIFLNSSAKLSQDIISGQLLNTVTFGSERITVRYSIYVTQYALTREAYQFWEVMKKNTEQVGSLFDPQPSQLISNIHAVNDPNEIVIGYVSAGSVNRKRHFINRADVEPWRYSTGCEKRDIPLDSLKYFFENYAYIPLAQFYTMRGLAGYTSSTRFCVDCTTRGTNIRPPFW